MSRPALLAAFARTVVATVFGGPVAGGQVAVSQAVELISSWLGAERAVTYDAMVARVERGLDQLAGSEGIPRAQLDQAIVGARQIILERGSNAAEMVALGLSPELIAGSVLSRSVAELRELDEASRGLCERTIRSVYASILSKPEALPELTRAFQRAVLQRLSELRSQPQEILAAMRGALEAAALVDHALEWRSELYSPAALLRAEFGIVPFSRREDVLADLRGWAATGEALCVRVYTGAGGMGKTRLLIELCRQLALEGWRTGFLNPEVSVMAWSLPLETVFLGDRRLLLVVDYAETRGTEVVAVLRRALSRTAGGPVRVVLLARALGDWWRSLASERGGVGDVLLGPAASVKPLDPIASDPGARSELFGRAAAAFASAVPAGPRGAPQAPPLDAQHYDRVLYILVAALAAVHGDAFEGERDLLDWALDREQAFLNDGIAAVGCDHLRGRAILQCAAVATLAGRARDRGDALRLLGSAPLLRGESAAVIDQVAELLHRLYPGEAWLQGVLPDLLGEHLVERALDDDPRLLEALFSRG